MHIILRRGTNMSQKALFPLRSACRWLVYGFCSFLWIWIAVNLPYTWDDFSWGTSIGVSYLRSGSQNSRYMGNLLEMAMTRSVPVKNIILSLTYGLIPALAARFIRNITDAPDKEELTAYLFCNLMLLLTFSEMWAQTFGWVAGAANFVISFLFLEIYLFVIWGELKKQGAPWKWLPFAGSFLLGVSMELFLENVALVAAVVSIGLYLYIRVLQKRRSAPLLGLVLGNFLGVAIMFSSPIYATLFQTGTAIDGYRSLSFAQDASPYAIVVKIITKFLGKYLPLIFGEKCLLPSALSVFGFGILLLFKKKYGALRWALPAISTGIMLYLLSVYVLGAPKLFKGMHYGRFFYDLLTGDFIWLLGFIEIWLIFDEKAEFGKRISFLALWAAVPGITGPLCATMESGPRVFFTSYCLLTIVAAMCLNELLRKLPVKVGKAVIALCLIICLVAGIRWVFVCGEIGATTRQRMKAIEQVQQGKTNVLYLDAYRFDRYLWYPDEVNNHAFRLFYHIPDSVEIKIVPIDAE